MQVRSSPKQAKTFSGYEGRLAVPDVDGDFEADCDVDGGDFLGVATALRFALHGYGSE